MKIRKAILTGGGRATRLHPITTTINKHLLPLANKPMIFHAIEKAMEAGVREIFINVNPGETELQKSVGDGGHWGINVTFYEQTGGPQGLAHVVKEAERFIGGEPFLFYLSDNILLGSITGMMEEFERGNYDCMLALSHVEDPERFGVPIFDEHNQLVDVLEKPQNPPNNFAVTGIYLYGPNVFFDAFNNIEKSARGEYEISSIHSDFLKRGLKVGHKEITGWWKDTGKHEDLLSANKLVLDHMSPQEGGGTVHIGLGSRIASDVKIVGPVIIAENCILEHCEIGPYVTIASGTEIRSAKIDHSIILDNCMVDCDLHISESVLGKNITLVKKKEAHLGRRMIIGDKTVIEL